MRTRRLTYGMRTRRLLPLVLVALLASGMAGCGGGSDGDGGKSADGDVKRLTLYSGRLEELVGPLLKDFPQSTGIKVDVRYGDSADLALLIEEEGDRSPADVFLSQSPGAMGFLDAKQRLVPIDEDVLDLVPSRFHADDGRWIGISGRVRVLVYNTDLVKAADLPASVLDLTRAEYRNKVGIAPTNASFQDFVSSMRALMGDAKTKSWLEGMKANGARAYAKNGPIVDAVARGEIAMGLVNNYYLEQAKNETPGIHAENHIFPNADIGSLILTTTVGVLDSANDKTAAEQLIRFLLAKDAQRFFTDETFEYPIVLGVNPAGGKQSLDEIKSPKVDLGSLGGEELVRTRRLIADSGLEQS